MSEPIVIETQITAPVIVETNIVDIVNVITQGPQGIQGATGPGVPAGGTAAQILAKASPDDYDTEWINIPPPVEYDAGNSGTAKTIDWNNGAQQRVSLTGNCVFTFTYPSAPTFLQLTVIQGNANYSATWISGITFAGGIPPVFPSASGKTATIRWYWNGVTLRHLGIIFDSLSTV